MSTDAELNAVECGERTLPEWYDFLTKAMDRGGDGNYTVTIRLSELGVFIAALESVEILQNELDIANGSMASACLEEREAGAGGCGACSVCCKELHLRLSNTQHIIRQMMDAPSLKMIAEELFAATTGEMIPAISVVPTVIDALENQ